MVPDNSPDAREIISMYTDKIIDRVRIYTVPEDPVESSNTQNRILHCLMVRIESLGVSLQARLFNLARSRL